MTPIFLTATLAFALSAAPSTAVPVAAAAPTTTCTTAAGAAAYDLSAYAGIKDVASIKLNKDLLKLAAMAAGMLDKVAISDELARNLDQVTFYAARKSAIKTQMDKDLAALRRNADYEESTVSVADKGNANATIFTRTQNGTVTEMLIFLTTDDDVVVAQALGKISPETMAGLVKAAKTMQRG